MTKYRNLTDKFWSSVITIAGGTGFAQIIGVLFTPIITRIYDPADFGTLTLILSVVGILSTLSSLRYESAITIEKIRSECIISKIINPFTVGYCFLLYFGVYFFHR